jgi:hypothetical protein
VTTTPLPHTIPQFDDAQSRERTAQAQEVLRCALERFRRPDGSEEYLVDAAWELERLGAAAWPVLWELILSKAQECEYFLGAVVRLEGVARQERLIVLRAAACNPDGNVRSRLLELLEEMPGELRGKVLEELAVAARPDDAVTDRAREAVREQPS